MNASSIPVTASGVLIIRGALILNNGNTDYTFNNITSVVIYAPGYIEWSGNNTLSFPNVTSFDIIGANSGNVQTVGLVSSSSNTGQRLVIGNVLIAVSSETSGAAFYSFTEFNLEGGLSTFRITPSTTASAICYDNPYSITIQQDRNPKLYSYDYTVTPSSGTGGAMSPAAGTAVSGPQVSILIPQNTLNSVTYTITCKIYRATDPDVLASKTFTIIVPGRAEYVWTGLVDETWTNPSNWLPSCGYPRDGADVRIPALSAERFYPKLNLNFISNHFNLELGASIDLNGFTLTLGNSALSNIIGSGFIKGSETSSIIFKGKTATLNFTQLTPGSTNALLNFTMNSSGQTVTLGNSLWIVGNVYPTAGTIASGIGNLTMVSTKTISSNITAFPLSGSEITGHVSVQSYITGGGPGLDNRGFRSMSSPINDALLASGNKTFKQMQTYIPITGPGGVANRFDQGGAAQPFAETITLYDETRPAFTAAAPSIATIDQQQVPGTGFLVFFRGSQGHSYANNSPKLNAPFVTPDPVTITFKGPINKNGISVPLTYTPDPNDKYNGYNLVGNPYPSAIDWTSVVKTANVVDSYIIVLPGGKQASYHDGTGNNLKTITGLTSTIIQPCQGFYVRASSKDGLLTFTESSKSTLPPNRMLTAPRDVIMSTDPLSFNGSDKVRSSAKVIRLNLQDGTNVDETTLVFKDGGSMLAGFEDALYFSGGAVTLGSLSSDGRAMAINGLPDIGEVKEVRLNVNATSSKILRLTFSDLSQAKGYEVFLKDSLFPGKVIDVKANPVYEFAIDKTKYETYGNERFTIVFRKEEIFLLPLNPFVAKKQNEVVELSWSLEASGIAKEFEVEQSSDGRTFHKIGSIRSQGNLSGEEKYYFIDADPIKGMNYYRVRQIHLNSRMSLSEIQSIDNSSLLNGTSKLTVYPNPAVDIIEAKTTGRINESTDFNVYNMQGRMVFSATFSGTELWRYDLSALEPTIYILEIRSSKTKKLIGRSKFVKAT